jgi:hypothetical protein
VPFVFFVSFVVKSGLSGARARLKNSTTKNTNQYERGSGGGRESLTPP